MRLRTDAAHAAGWHRALVLGALSRKDGSDYSYTESVPVAEPGDVWRLRDGGYALTCPNEACDQGVHYWDHEYDCNPPTRKCSGTCWSWSGSPEEGTLTASPSLHVLAEKGGCGWHGWLRNGQMVSV